MFISTKELIFFSTANEAPSSTFSTNEYTKTPIIKDSNNENTGRLPTISISIYQVPQTIYYVS